LAEWRLSKCRWCDDVWMIQSITVDHLLAFGARLPKSGLDKVVHFPFNRFSCTFSVDFVRISMCHVINRHAEVAKPAGLWTVYTLRTVHYSMLVGGPRWPCGRVFPPSRSNHDVNTSYIAVAAQPPRPSSPVCEQVRATHLWTCVRRAEVVHPSSLRCNYCLAASNRTRSCCQVYYGSTRITAPRRGEHAVLPLHDTINSSNIT